VADVVVAELCTGQIWTPVDLQLATFALAGVEPFELLLDFLLLLVDQAAQVTLP
jgi:hypothetical protein